MRIALYEPDIPQNTGAVLRLAACLGVAVDLIGPFGFVLSDTRLKRASLDYLGLADVARHDSWPAYLASRRGAPGRLVLLTTAGAVRLPDFPFEPGDTLLFGRESAGAPPAVHEAADARVVIPMRPDARSLNLATAVAMALAEALRQTGLYPRPEAAPR